MVDPYKKSRIDEYIANLHKYYDNCLNPGFYGSNTFSYLDADEIVYLNQNLHLDALLSTSKKNILIKVLENPAKLNFAKYLLLVTSIELELNSLNIEGKSCFQLLIENASYNSIWFHNRELLLLYERGYKHIAHDSIFLIDFYNNKILTQDVLELWCFARICYKLKDIEQIRYAFEHEKVLFTIISFKLGKPVGINYPNLLGIANSALQHYTQYGKLIIHAMNFYKVYDEIYERDRNDTFKLKINDFNKYQPIQDVAFNEIAFKVFPELKY